MFIKYPRRLIALNFDNFENSNNSFLWPEYFFMGKMDPMSGFDIRLVFTLPPRESTVQYKRCAHLWNNFPCISTLIRGDLMLKCAMYVCILSVLVYTCTVSWHLISLYIQLNPKWAIQGKKLSNVVLTILRKYQCLRKWINSHKYAGTVLKSSILSFNKKKLNICNIPSESEKYDIWWILIRCMAYLGVNYI